MYCVPYVSGYKFSLSGVFSCVYLININYSNLCGKLVLQMHIFSKKDLKIFKLVGLCLHVAMCASHKVSGENVFLSLARCDP